MSPTRHNFDNLQFIAWVQEPGGEFRMHYGLAVMFDHHASREKLLSHQKLLDRASEGGGGLGAITGNGAIFHTRMALSQSFQTGSYPSRRMRAETSSGERSSAILNWPVA